MLFTEFVEHLDFASLVTKAMHGVGKLPMVSNSAPRILNKLHRDLPALFNEPGTRERLLAACCSASRVPDNLSYYLVDDLSLQTNEDGEVEAHWFSYMGDAHLDIAVFRLITKDFSLCGKNMSFVEGVEFVRGICPDMADAVLAVLEQHKASGRDLFERWCFASDDWRSSHLICPNCGSQISPYRADHGLEAAECNECGWVSRKKYYYESDFANVESMKAERKRAKKEREREMAFKEQYQKLTDQINSYGLAAIHENPKIEVFHHYLDGLRKAQEELKKAENAMLEKLKPKR